MREYPSGDRSDNVLSHIEYYGSPAYRSESGNLAEQNRFRRLLASVSNSPKDCFSLME